MRAMFCLMILVGFVGCEGSQGSKGFDGSDGGDPSSEVKDTEVIQDTEVKDTEVIQDTEVLDSEVQDTEIIQDTEVPDSDSASETEDSEVQDTEIIQDTDSESEQEPESCVFSEKGDERCVGQAIEQCLEDPNSSTIELIWQNRGECSLGTECIERVDMYPNITCANIGECTVGASKCEDDQLKECIYDEESGGGVWSVSEDCAAKNQKCDSRVFRCVDLDWEYCDASGPTYLTTKCEENVIFKCEVDTWVELKDCGDSLSCGFDEDIKGWICYDQCIYQCMSSKSCSLGLPGGTVVYGVGDCLNDEVCCKR